MVLQSKNLEVKTLTESEASKWLLQNPYISIVDIKFSASKWDSYICYHFYRNTDEDQQLNI